MRLLNTKTLELETFNPGDVPTYAILSHTWGAKEVLYQDLVGSADRPRVTRRWEKVHRSCELASAADYSYIWIDSCCIDKSSSAELSEAINSMFRWYAEADVCFAYLEDVSLPGHSEPDLGREALFDDERYTLPTGDALTMFAGSRWFKRGWTLQELLAPRHMVFYVEEWTPLGTRCSLQIPISIITSIPLNILRPDLDLPLDSRPTFSMLESMTVAERMSWAAKRETTRPEDLAYCLMGLFNINMPLLYGEGGTRAFRRLQEEIVRSSVDESIYCWALQKDQITTSHHGLLATHPSAFDHEHCRDIQRPRFLSRNSRNVTTITGEGLQLKLLRTPNPLISTRDIFLTVLACDLRDWHDDGEISSPVLILQRTSSWNTSEFVRIRPEIILRACKNKIIWPPGFQVPASFGLSLEEPALREIYVPHGKPYVQQPRGLLLEVQGLTQDRCITVFGLWLGTFASGPLELRFGDRANVPDTWTRTVVLGAIKLPPVLTGLYTPETTSCVVVGTSPLPDNQLGARSFFVDTWVAFETLDRVQKRDFSALETLSGRAKNTQTARPFQASMTLRSRYSRLYHHVAVSVSGQ